MFGGSVEGQGGLASHPGSRKDVVWPSKAPAFSLFVLLSLSLALSGFLSGRDLCVWAQNRDVV